MLHWLMLLQLMFSLCLVVWELAPCNTTTLGCAQDTEGRRELREVKGLSPVDQQMVIM
jgi:hypothetical protein